MKESISNAGFYEYLIALGQWCSPDIGEANKQLFRLRRGFHDHIKAKHGGTAIPNTCHKCLHYQHDIRALNSHISGLESEVFIDGNIY